MLVSKLPGWNYVENQADAERLMDAFNGFHDSILTSLNYVGGGFVDEEGIMYFERRHKLEMHFDSQWADSLELVFEGLIDLHLTPAPENCSDDIFDADLWLEDETVWLALDSAKDVPRDDSHTWAHAYSLRWRFVSSSFLQILRESPQQLTAGSVERLSAHIAKDPSLLTSVLAPWTLCEKSRWDSFAQVIANQSDAVLEHYAPGVLNWMQDLNWPGSMRLFERLAKVRPGKLDRAIEETIDFAENVCRDEEWAYFLRQLQQERIKI